LEQHPETKNLIFYFKLKKKNVKKSLRLPLFIYNFFSHVYAGEACSEAERILDQKLQEVKDIFFKHLFF